MKPAANLRHFRYALGPEAAGGVFHRATHLHPGQEVIASGPQEDP
jgi:hypothetical protein